MQGSDRSNDQRSRQVGCQDHMDEAVGEGRIEDDCPPVGRHVLANLVDLEALGRLHPGVHRKDPGGRHQRPEGDHQRREEMQALADAVAAEQHDAQEPGFEEEGGQDLISHERTDNRSSLVGKHAPVRAELVGHDDARHDAHAEREREDRLPEVEQLKIDFLLRPQPQSLQNGKIAGQPDRKGGKDDVKGDRKGKLDASQKRGIEVIEHHRLSSSSHRYTRPRPHEMVPT